MTTLTAKHQRLAALRPLSPESVASLAAAWDVRMVYESNNIEGNSLTLRETELVLSKGVTVSGKPLEDQSPSQSPRTSAPLTTRPSKPPTPATKPPFSPSSSPASTKNSTPGSKPWKRRKTQDFKTQDKNSLIMVTSRMLIFNSSSLGSCVLKS